MSARESPCMFAWAEDSRTEAFEGLRVPARMLGVRKGGLGVKVSLLGKEVILRVTGNRPGHTSLETSFSVQPLLARGILLAPSGRKETGLVLLGLAVADG